MELRQLRYFVAVAETGNISRAARKIFLTQPALSRQIKALEDELGQCLLERSANAVKLTAAGEHMLREARDLLLHADQALERVRSAATAGRLRVGYSPSLASGLLSPALGCFTQAHPATRVDLFDLAPGEMMAGLEAGTLDVAITVSGKDGAQGINWTPLVRARWTLAVGPSHPLARRSRVGPADLAREPLLVYRMHDYPEYWEAIAAWMRTHGLHPRIAGEYDGVESLIAAVESGLGVAVVVTRIGNLFPERVRLLPLSKPPTPVTIAAGLRSDQAGNKPLAVFIEELRRAAKALP